MQVFSINQTSFSGKTYKNFRKAKKLLAKQKANSFNKPQEVKTPQPKMVKHDPKPAPAPVKQEQDNEIRFVGMLQTLEEFSRRLNLKD